MQLSTRRYLLGLALALFTSLSQANHEGGAEVKIDEIAAGDGAEAMRFSIVEVHYTGKLDSGQVFDSSVERGEPIRFTLGAGQVIPGWEMGILGMKVGGKRVLTIPPELAYGDRGAGNVIPPKATLTFDVELVSAEPPPFESIGSEEVISRLEQGVKLIDIRRPEEWKETGVIEGSIQSTAFDSKGNYLEAFAKMLESTVQPDEEFMLICRTGNRTSVLSNYLTTQGGFKKVINVQDGITKWIEEGRPVDKQ